jgi:hypothetical protein
VATKKCVVLDTDRTDKCRGSMRLLTKLRSGFVKMCKLAHAFKNIVIISILLIHFSSHFTLIFPVFFNSDEELATLSQDTAHSFLYFRELYEACRMNFTRFVIILAEGS